MGAGTHAAVETGSGVMRCFAWWSANGRKTGWGLAVAVRGCGEVFVQAADGQPHGPDLVFRAGLAAHGVLLLEDGKFLTPKALRKGGGEQLRRGFVQPGNAIIQSPLPYCNLHAQN